MKTTTKILIIQARCFEAWDEIRNQRPNTGDTSLSRTTRARTPTKTYEEVYKKHMGNMLKQQVLGRVLWQLEESSQLAIHRIHLTTPC